MFSKIINIILVISVFAANLTVRFGYKPSPVPSILHGRVLAAEKQDTQIISEKTYSLSDRYGDTFVNNVFADNILLTLAYMRGEVTKGQEVNWDKVRENFNYSFVLKPGDTFAFHNAVLPEYKDMVILTPNVRFNSDEGFKSDGWLTGDGVCHLASFMNVVAKRANLFVKAPTRHYFANIPDVSREDGVAIFYGSGPQNLYITNSLSTPIMFVFTHKDQNLDIKVEKLG